MVKQKIQDNLLVLERDCVEVLDKTETLLQGNKVTKAKLSKVTAGLLTEYVVFVLGVALLCLLRSWAGVRCSYCFMMLLTPGSQLVPNEKVMGEGAVVG